MKKIFFTTVFFTLLCPACLKAQSNLSMDREALNNVDRTPDVVNELKDECPFFSTTNWYINSVSLEARRNCTPSPLNLLTDQEVVSIIDKVPNVATALKGGCPLFSSMKGWDSDTVSVQVRRSCGPYSGALIGNYEVNKRNGSTTTGFDSLLPVLDSAGEAFAKQLVAQAQKRVLSLDEARCLAREAAKTLPELNDNSVKISVKLSDKTASLENTAAFIITDTSARPSANSGRMFKVHLDDAKIYVDGNDINITSPDIDSLVSKLFELRIPMWLTKKEIEKIILAVPEIADLVTNECIPYANNESSSRSAAGISCRSSITIADVYVNPQTGEITDSETAKPLDTPESRQIARQLFDQKSLRKNQLRKEIEAICKS